MALCTRRYCSCALCGRIISAIVIFLALIVAIGINQESHSKAIGINSESIGLCSKAHGLNSKAIAYNSESIGLNSKVIGLNTKNNALTTENNELISKVYGLIEKSINSLRENAEALATKVEHARLEHANVASSLQSQQREILSAIATTEAKLADAAQRQEVQAMDSRSRRLEDELESWRPKAEEQDFLVSVYATLKDLVTALAKDDSPPQHEGSTGKLRPAPSRCHNARRAIDGGLEQ